jgi:hypothetical protein
MEIGSNATPRPDVSWIKRLPMENRSKVSEKKNSRGGGNAPFSNSAIDVLAEIKISKDYSIAGTT